MLVAVPQRFDEDGVTDLSVARDNDEESAQVGTQENTTGESSGVRYSLTTTDSFSCKSTTTSSESQQSSHCVLQFSTAVYYCTHTHRASSP